MPGPLSFNLANTFNNPLQSPFQNLKFNSPMTPVRPPSRMAQLGPDTEKLKQILVNAPTRDAYKPTKMGALSSVLSGLSASLSRPGTGYATYANRMDEPYNRAQEDYTREVGRYSVLSDLEKDAFARAMEEATFDYEKDKDVRDFAFEGTKFDFMKGQTGVENAAANRRMNQTDEQMRRGSFNPYTNPKTGITELKSGFSPEVFNMGQTELTPGEKTGQALNQFKGQSNISFNLGQREADEQLKRNMIQSQFTSGLGTQRDAAKIAATTAAAKQRVIDKLSLDPTKVAYSIYVNELGGLINEDPDYDRYIEKDTYSGLPMAVRPWNSDENKYKRVSEMLQRIKLGSVVPDGKVAPADPLGIRK